MVSLREPLAGVGTKKARLGLRDTPAEVDAVRNKGATRTAEKRELLRRADERARAAGRQPVISYY